MCPPIMTTDYGNTMYLLTDLNGFKIYTKASKMQNWVQWVPRNIFSQQTP